MQILRALITKFALGVSRWIIMEWKLRKRSLSGFVELIFVFGFFSRKVEGTVSCHTPADFLTIQRDYATYIHLLREPSTWPYHRIYTLCLYLLVSIRRRRSVTYI